MAVLPRQTALVARIGDALGLPGLVHVEGFELMAQDWRFSAAKAEHELGFQTRPLDQTLKATIGWYRDLIASRAFRASQRSALSSLAATTRTLGKLGLLEPLKLGQRVAGRRVIAGV